MVIGSDSTYEVAEFITEGDVSINIGSRRTRSLTRHQHGFAAVTAAPDVVAPDGSVDDRRFPCANDPDGVTDCASLTGQLDAAGLMQNR